MIHKKNFAGFQTIENGCCLLLYFLVFFFFCQLRSFPCLTFSFFSSVCIPDRPSQKMCALWGHLHLLNFSLLVLSSGWLASYVGQSRGACIQQLQFHLHLYNFHTLPMHPTLHLPPPLSLPNSGILYLYQDNDAPNFYPLFDIAPLPKKLPPFFFHPPTFPRVSPPSQLLR